MYCSLIEEGGSSRLINDVRSFKYPQRKHQELFFTAGVEIFPTSSYIEHYCWQLQHCLHFQRNTGQWSASNSTLCSWNHWWRTSLGFFRVHILAFWLFGDELVRHYIVNEISIFFCFFAENKWLNRAVVASLPTSIPTQADLYMWTCNVPRIFRSDLRDSPSSVERLLIDVLGISFTFSRTRSIFSPYAPSVVFR